MVTRVLVSDRPITDPTALGMEKYNISDVFRATAATYKAGVRSAGALFSEPSGNRACITTEADYKIVEGQLKITPATISPLVGDAPLGEHPNSGLSAGCLIADFTDEAAATNFVAELKQKLGGVKGVHIEHGPVPAHDPAPAL